MKFYLQADLWDNSTEYYIVYAKSGYNAHNLLIEELSSKWRRIDTMNLSQTLKFDKNTMTITASLGEPDDEDKLDILLEELYKTRTQK